MTYKSNFGNNPRTIYVAKGGNDGFAGDTEETAVLTIGQATTLINALVPPPDAANPATIIVTGSGNYDETVSLPEGCQFNASTSFVFPTTGNAIEAGAQALFSATSAGATANSTNAVLINNKQRAGVTLAAIEVFGETCTGITISGSSDGSFANVGELRITGDGSTGILDQTSNGTPEIYNVSSILLNSNSCIGIDHDPTASTSAAVIRCAFIGETTTVTGTTAVRIQDGHLSVSANEMLADTALDVLGGRLDMACADMEGDITVASGATLNCTIANYTGTITNNGTINGRIGNQIFGNFGFTDTVVVDGDLLVNGNLVAVDTETVLVGDQYIITGSGYTSVVQTTGGLAVNIGSANVSDSVSSGAFVAGVPATSNPTVTTVGSDTFSVGDLIDITGTNLSENNGFYEVLSHSGTTLTIRGIGLTDTLEDFTRRDFIANASDNATITQVNVSVARANTSGLWEEGTGNTTPFTYTPLGGGDVVGPGSSTNSAIATWDGTTGALLKDNPLSILTETAGNTLLTLDSPSGTGTSGFVIADSSGTLKGEFEYNESTDLVQLLTTSATLQFGVGPGTGLFDFVGNDASVLFDFGGTANNVTIQVDNPDTSPPLIIETGGTNGANISVYTGNRDPEGNVTANPGSLYIRRDGTSSRIYQLEAASSANTPWVPADGNVEGPASSTDTALATWDGTSGTLLQDNSRATLFQDADVTAMIFDSGSASGQVVLRFDDSSNATVASFAYLETLDQTILTDASSAGLRIIIGDSAGELLMDGVNHADTNKLISFETAMTNGAVADFFVGNRNPEGNVTADPGAIYYRIGGVNSRIYQRRAAAAGNTSWVETGDVKGPATTVDTAVATWNGTDGENLNSLTLITATEGGGQTQISVESPSGSGTAGIEFLDSSQVNQGSLIFSEAASSVILIGQDTNGIEILATSGIIQLQTNQSNSYVEIDANVADTVSPFRVITAGLNGAEVDIYVGNRDPEGNITADPGSIYYRIDGVNSRTYQLEAAATGNTGWVANQGNVDGPGSSTDNGLATWNGTTGTDLNALALITAVEGASITQIALESAGVTGSASVEFLDSSSVAQGSWGYTESTDDIVFVSSAGAGMDFIIGTGNVDFQFNQAAGAFDLVGPSHTDGNPLLSMETSSTNGGTVTFYVGDRDPEGNVTADPGSIYYRIDGVNSRTYQLEAASTGNTGWVANEGSVDGPGSSTDTAIVSWNGTGGSDLSDNPLSTITSTGITLDTSGATASTAFSVRDNVSTVQGIFQYNQNTDQLNIVESTGNGLFFDSLTGNFNFAAQASATGSNIVVPAPSAAADSSVSVADSSLANQVEIFYSEPLDVGFLICNTAEFRIVHEQEIVILSDSSAQNFLRLRTPDPTSIGGFIIDDSNVNPLMQLLYSETLDQNQLFEFAGNGMLFRTDNGFSSLGFGMADTAELWNWETDGTNGSIIGWHVGNRDPESNVTGAPGALYLRGDGVNSNIYIHKDAGTNNSNWAAVGDVSSDFVSGTNEAIAYFNGTTGKIITEDDSVTIDPASTQAGLRFTTPSGGTGAALSFRNIAASVRSNIFYSQGSDSFTIQHLGSGDFNLNSDTTFDFQGNSIPDTTPIFTWRNTGTNPGTVDVYVGDRDPFGNVNADPGSIYFREDGSNSDIYIHRDSIASTTGWTDILATGVKTNLSSSTDGAVTVWGGVTGTVVQEVAQVVINESAGVTTINARVGSANGSANLELADTVGFGIGNLRYDDNANTVTLEALASTTLNLFADAAPIRIEHDEGGGNNALLNLVTNTADSRVFVHNATPVGAHNGNPGDLFIEENGTQSDIYIHSGATTNNTDWSALRTDKSMAALDVVGNATATTIAAINTWTDLNLNASAAPSIGNTNWTVTNTTTGEVTYNGTNTITVVSIANLSMSGLAGQDTYQIRTLVNGAVTADNIIAQTTFNAQNRNLTIIAPITVSTNDTVRLQVQNTTAADDLVVINLSHIIR